ncbi:UNVERIFIED_CONTAM: hypothetical protein Cloal_3549 [Acetivibrio alkalicellulosi]
MDKFYTLFRKSVTKELEKKIVHRINNNAILLFIFIPIICVSVVLFFFSIILLFSKNEDLANQYLGLSGGIVTAFITFFIIRDIFDPIKKLPLNDKIFIYIYLFMKDFKNFEELKYIKKAFASWRLNYFLNRLYVFLYAVKVNYENLFISFDTEKDYLLNENIRTMFPDRIKLIMKNNNYRDKVQSLFDLMLDSYGCCIQKNYTFINPENIKSITYDEKEIKQQELSTLLIELGSININNINKETSISKFLNVTKVLVFNRKLQAIFVLTLGIIFILYAMFANNKLLNYSSAIASIIGFIIVIMQIILTSNNTQNKDL